MASLNSLQMRALNAQTTAIRYTEDEPVALRISNTSGKAVTSVIVTTAVGIDLIDSVGTTSVDFATYGTLGTVADKINSSGTWTCKILDGLRSTLTTASNLVDGTLTSNVKFGEVGYDVKLDTTTTFTFPIRCTYDRTAEGIMGKEGHRVKINKFEHVLDVGTAAIDMVKIIEWDPILNTETQIWSAASVDSTTTATTHDFSKAPITAKEGNDLIVLVTDAAAITNAATNYVQVIYTRE